MFKRIKMKNIIKENDKYFVCTIKKCTCEEKDGNNYILICTIKEKGTKIYTYQKDQDYISKYDGKRLYLSSEAKTLVQNTIDDFERELQKFNKSKLDYLRLSNNCYVLMLKKSGRTSIKQFNSVNDLAHYTMCMYDNRDGNRKSILSLAIEKNDRLLTLQLKSYYCDATIDEIHELEKLTHKRILPCLPDKYNKSYAVIEKTINHQLLKDSGYKYIHQPYFSMNGSTHSCYSLNPYTKTVIDAAKVTKEYITFDDYLELFNMINNQ